MMGQPVQQIAYGHTKLATYRHMMELTGWLKHDGDRRHVLETSSSLPQTTTTHLHLYLCISELRFTNCRHLNCSVIGLNTVAIVSVCCVMLLIAWC